ncbi:MAG: site-specific DNA-methyltransferase [Candidatus Woesearchaeota archaeon]
MIKNESETKFYDTLKDIFIGAKVEGFSGYINLMKIKSQYFDKVFISLRKEIQDRTKEFPEFKEELYDKLYSFFKRYFSESGSVYFVKTPFSEKIYERVYTDNEDVTLFWKTHMLYYVKTDRIFNSIKIELDGFKFFFDVSKLEHRKAWEKKDIIYKFKGLENDGTIVFDVSYSERGKGTNIEEIRKKLKEKGIVIDEETLEKAFRIFEKQSEVDYFINKNAKQFLKEQFDLWLYQYIYSDESNFSEKRIRQLKVLKDIAYKIIDFISQFEDELVKIWNKPKFVLNSNYVITLDRIAEKGEKGIKLIEKLIKDKGFEEQIKEWKELEIIENFDKNKLFVQTLNGKSLNKDYKFLPIDTKYFDEEIKYELLSLFENLDQELDGWLIKSENYQALNTILPKFKEKVQTIYIDPPFNKDQDADYFYSVKFKDATWATMLENRLQLARDLLKDTGSIFVRCDYNGNWIVRPLMNEIFGKENFRNEIIVTRGEYPKGEVNKLRTGNDNILFYARSNKNVFLAPRKKREERKWFSMHLAGERGSYELQVREFFGKKLLPPKGRHWIISQEKINELIEKGEIRINENKTYIDLQGNLVVGEPEMLQSEFEVLDSNWTDIQSYSTSWNFRTENSEILLKRVIESTSNEGDLIMDFFLGSGTTTAVAHKLKRKWIGIEMGEHFWTVVLPRMKKVLAYDKSGISKEKDVKEKYNENNAGGFFKYFELEQFEQTLRNVKYDCSDPFLIPGNDPYNQYIFMKDLKLLEALEIDYKENKVKVDLYKLYDNIDIAETLSCLLGKMIKKVSKDEVEFEDGTKIDLKNLDYKLIKPLIWWGL